MREECQSLMVELQMLLDTKQVIGNFDSWNSNFHSNPWKEKIDQIFQTLDAEIAIYRKMLEGEEDRAGLKQLVEQVVKTHAIQQEADTGGLLYFIIQ